MDKLASQFSIFPIGLGAMPLSIQDRPSTAEALKVIETFLLAGGNFIDTADVYGLDENDKGHNEQLICQALKRLGYRDKVIVATKGGATRPNGGWDIRGGAPYQLRIACEQSLKNLQVDAHSLYYLHGPDPEVPFEDSIGELANLQQEGKIIHIGVANINLAQLISARTITPIKAVQNRCNPFCKEDVENGLIEYCREQNIKYIPYCPLGGWSEHTNLAKSDIYQEIIQEQHMSSYEINLAWLLSKGKHIIPIPGMDKPNQIAINFKALEHKLKPNVIAKLDALPNLFRAVHSS